MDLVARDRAFVGGYPPHPPSFADAVRDFTQNTHVRVLAHILCLSAGKDATLFMVMVGCRYLP